jgi:hypothetical protein
MEGAMAFREKSAWAAMAATLLVWGWYLIGAWRELSGGSPSSADMLGLFVRCVILTVVVEAVLAIALAVAAPKAADKPADERERLIELRATRIAYWILSIGAVSVALTSPLVAAGGLRLLPDPLENTVLVLANGILLSLVAAELAKAAAQVAAYRRGA